MKTSIINKLAALLTVSGLLTIIAPLTVTAQNLTVTSNTTVSGTHYENNGSNPALINTSTWTFTGSDVIISGTNTAANNGRIGANFTGGGKLNLTDSRVDANYYGIQLTDTSAATLHNTVINSDSSYGVYLLTSSTLTMTGGTITTGSTGILLTGSSAAMLTDTVINGNGVSSAGVSMTTYSTLTMTGGTITANGNGINVGGATVLGVTINMTDTVINARAVGVALSGTSKALLDNINITTQQTSGYGVSVGMSSAASFSGTIHTLGNAAYGLNITGTSEATLNNVNITTQNTNAHGVGMATSSTLTMTGGTITTGTTGANGINAATASVIDARDATINAYNIGVSLSSTSKAILENANITTQNTSGYGLNLGTSSTASFSGTIVTHGTSAHGAYLSSTSALTLGDNVHITTNNSGQGINVTGNSLLSAGDHLSINSGGVGINVTAGSAITAPLNNVSIATRDASAHGINYASGIAPLTMNGGTIHTLNTSAYGLNLSGTSTATLNNVNIITEGTTASGVYSIGSSTLTVSGGTIHTLNTNAHGLSLVGASTAALNDVNIITEGTNAHGINVGNSSAVTVTGGTVTTRGENTTVLNANTNNVTLTATGLTGSSAQGDGLRAQNGATVTLTDSDLTVGNHGLVTVGDAVGNTVSVSGGTLSAGRDLIHAVTGTSVITLTGVSATNGANVLNTSGPANISVTANHTPLTGDLNAAGNSAATLTLNNSALTGKSTVSDSATLALNVGNNAVWNVTGSSSLTTLSNSGTVIIANALGEDLTVSGAYTQDADGTLDLNIISGSGPVITADTASISGTLRVAGLTSGTAAAKASEIVAKNFTVIHTANGISGDFSTVDFGVAASAVDYITLAVGKSNNDLDYALNYGLSWFAASSTSHGNFTIASGTSFEIDITLSDTAAGQGAGGWDGKSLTKKGDGLLIVSSNNNFTGGTTIASGTLRLTNLVGLGTGTVNVAQTILSVLDLSASGTYKNDTTGAGTVIVSGSGVNISGNNSTFTGAWDVTGSGTMTSQQNLGVSGTTAVNIAQNGALSLILGSGDYHFDQPLTGSGFLLIQNAGNITLVPSVPLVAYVPAFTGTVELQHNTLALSADNALPLTLATLVTGTNNLVVVDSDPSATARNLGALSFSGGTIRFEGYDPHATRADTIIALSGTLNLSGGGTVEVVMPNPSQIPDGSKFTHIPLLQQDDGLALTQLISASGGVTGSPATLTLRDDNGRIVSDSYTLNLSHDGVTTDAIGTYDYLLSTGSANDGLYVAFGLKQVDIQAGRTLTLDQDTPTPAKGDDFSVTIIGAGNLNISATTSITLNGTGNSYSGTTIVNTGTLIVGIDEQMFASSTAFVINSGAALNTNGYDQQVNNLSGSGLATFTNNTLTVNNSTNTNFTGTLNGSVLVKDGAGSLNVNDAKATLTQVQIENGEIILGSNATVSGNGPAVLSNGGTATFNASSLSTSGSVLILAKDNAPAVVNLNNMSVSVSGSGHLVEIDKGALTVNLNSTAATGDISAFNGSTGLVNLTNNSVLTGRIDPVGVNIDHSTWNMTGRSRITTLHGANGGTITIDNVEGEYLTVSGGITGQTALNLTLSDSVKGNQEIWVVVDETNNMTGERFTLSHEVSYGMYNYNLVNANDGAWLVYTGSSGTIPPVNPPPVNPPTISDEGDTIINTAAAVAGFWFTQLDNLHKRMGELRYNKPANADALDNIWVRAYGQQINANTGIYSVKGFSETQYGVDLGTDYLWKLDAANQLYTGIFAGYGGADRDFHTNYSGSTDSGYGGLYATWLNNSGWYADVVAKGQYFRNEFSGADRGDYDSVGLGFSVELGRQFEFKDGWFVEPSAQFSYLHLMNDNYTTRDNLHVNLTDADVLHIYGGARFGRNIKLTHSGLLQPYIKAGGLGQISSGNKLTVSGDHWRPNLDGARAVVGAGLIWQLDADSQLHLDYEASFGEKYDKPWGVNFGYRYQF